MLNGGESPIRTVVDNSYGLSELFQFPAEMPQCRVTDEPATPAEPPVCELNPGSPNYLRLFEPEHSQAFNAYEVGFSLIAMANESGDYESAIQLLGQAGQIFTQFGYKDEAKNANNLMIDLARTNGRSDDAAYYSALAAMGENNVAEIERLLQDVPADYAGREILDDYIATYRNLERMSYTLAAAESLIEAHLSTMAETETSFLGWVFSTDFTEAKRAYAHAKVAWRQRLESGRFDSTRAILQDIWDTDPKARRGLATLAGYFGAWQGDEYAPTRLSDALENQYGDHVTLGDLVGQEEDPDPQGFHEHLSIVCANADNGGKLEVSAVASIYREQADFSADMSGLIDNEFANRGAFVFIRDALHGFTQPQNIAIMVGSFGLARLTTAAIMAKVAPAGIEGLSLAARVGVTATEVGIESGAFTLYQRLLTQALTTQRVDWSADSFAKDWASLAMCFGFLRAATVPLTSLRRTLGRTSTFGVEGGEPVIIGGRTYLPLNTAGTVLFGITENAVQTAAFYGGGVVSYQMDFRDVPPNFFEEWLNLIQFQMGTRAANYVTNGWLNRTAHQIETRPLIEAAQTIAEGVVGRRSAQADIIAQHIYIAQVRGDVSKQTLHDLGKRFSNEQTDSVDDVMQINTIFKNAKLPLLYDGTRLYEVSPEARDAYMTELASTGGTGGQLDLGSLAYAFSTSNGSMTVTSDAQTSDVSGQTYFSTNVAGITCSEPRSHRNVIVIDFGSGKLRFIDTTRFPEKVTAYNWSNTPAAAVITSIEGLLNEAASRYATIADDTRATANREYAGREMPEAVKKQVEELDAAAWRSLELIDEFKRDMKSLEYIYRYAPGDNVRNIINAGMETILRELQQLELQSTSIAPDVRARVIYEQLNEQLSRHLQDVVHEAEGNYINDEENGVILFLNDSLPRERPVAQVQMTVPAGIELHPLVLGTAGNLGLADYLSRAFNILLNGADVNGRYGRAVRDPLQGHPHIGEVRFQIGAAPRIYFARRLGDGRIHILQCGIHDTQAADIVIAQKRYDELAALIRGDGSN